MDLEIEAVKSAIRDCVAAYSTDLEKYFSFYADDMLMVIPDYGQLMTKEEYYQYWTQHVADGFGAAKASVDDLRVQMSPSGDAASAYFLEPTLLRFPEGHENSGQSVVHTYVQTCTLFKRDGRWLIVNINVTTRHDCAVSA